ncbi:hypothetical protein P175DRAFT_0497646 [Aspergillus ochraceoroseus IBT 24754]|uniref:Transglutaminase-like domain-containing protein n=2 Tax=Aspergillus ochraceoroseus TaxID=138278 RepID=A0A2T5M7J2_9EURO|nr:uncharacterized protein P175DRAFT_0497646 [Aspergillus ochraceoroseus IBT 24754]KKK20832.1 hypothetical protein AOCH_002327 [Aspergillus ochraceoroseus]PTU24509.1 hypothetical protein P175DRAFT_0497646 [Aspergillus ochraceoroseus IBT 24754]
MADETQVLSIQDRIKALKQAQAGQGTEGPGSPFLGSQQPTAFALRPAPPRANSITNNTLSHNSSNGSAPPKLPACNTIPIPGVPPRPIPRPTPNDVTPATGQKPRIPPPLPARKSSSQLAPSLPPRRPSGDSIASDVSGSTSTSSGRSRVTAASSTGSVVRAPAWGVGELPPLPLKRQPSQPILPVSRPKATTTPSSGSLSAPRPSLPPRRSSNQSVVSTESSSFSQSRLPPALPSRDKSPAPSEEIGSRQPTKRLPPPPPSGAELDKIQRSGFSAMHNKILDRDTKGAGREQIPAEVPPPAPPPVPLALRPDLSQIQATKPKVFVTNGTPVVQSSGCLKCRDFSGPDTHAARYPRESLPTQDIGWLARELTAPFISHTDKARALFTWLHHNVDYDVYSFFNRCVKPSTPSSTLASGLAVCEGYAGLFAALAIQAGLEAAVVSGHGKGYGYSAPAPGAPLPPQAAGHAWNVVRIDNGQWKLIDPCWGAGHIQGPGQPYVRSFNPAMFTDSNDEFGLRHFPTNASHFYRDDGRPEISWEEYILGHPNSPFGAAQPNIYGDADKHSIGRRSFRPAAECISVNQPGPLRVQFNLICEHWTLEGHSRAKPGLFLLLVHGIDGRNDDRLPLTHYRGAGPTGGGDVWYVDVPDARILGAPGQQVQLAVLTSFGDKQDARGVTAEEYRRQVGRVGMAWAIIAEWELVA